MSGCTVQRTKGRLSARTSWATAQGPTCWEGPKIWGAKLTKVPARKRSWPLPIGHVEYDPFALAICTIQDFKPNRPSLYVSYIVGLNSESPCRPLILRSYHVGPSRFLMEFLWDTWRPKHRWVPPRLIQQAEKSRPQLISWTVSDDDDLSIGNGEDGHILLLSYTRFLLIFF